MRCQERISQQCGAGTNLNRGTIRKELNACANEDILSKCQCFRMTNLHLREEINPVAMTFCAYQCQTKLTAGKYHSLKALSASLNVDCGS